MEWFVNLPAWQQILLLFIALLAILGFGLPTSTRLTGDPSVPLPSTEAPEETAEVVAPRARGYRRAGDPERAQRALRGEKVPEDEEPLGI
mgnify:CR=1 FL=1